jgi:hypothetical protein
MIKEEWINDGQGNMVKVDPEPARVVLEYDRVKQGWDIIVSGVDNPTDALHAFIAASLTARHVIPSVDANKAEPLPDGKYKIHVGVNPAINPEAIPPSTRQSN